MTKTKALLLVLAILAVSAAYADYKVFTLNGTVSSNQRSDTQALCSFRADLQRRVTQGKQFLLSHPRGILGIPAATLQVSLRGQESTLRALAPLAGHCPHSTSR